MADAPARRPRGGQRKLPVFGPHKRPKKPYHRVTGAEISALVTAYNQHGDYLAIGSGYNMSKSGVYRVIARAMQLSTDQVTAVPWVPAARRVGPRKKKIDSELATRALQLLKKMPYVTVKQLRAQLRAEFPGKPKFSVSTLNRWLEVSGITFKVAQIVPQGRNTEATKRKDFVGEVSKLAQDGLLLIASLVAPLVLCCSVVLCLLLGVKLIFMDECGVNLWTRQKRGRAARGARAQIVRSSVPGCNTTLMLAVCADYGIAASKLFPGAGNRQQFEAFLHDVKTFTAQHCDDKFVLICDNARFHDAQAAQNALENTNCICKFQPPYTPQLNACDMAATFCVAFPVRV